MEGLIRLSGEDSPSRMIKIPMNPVNHHDLSHCHVTSRHVTGKTRLTKVSGMRSLLVAPGGRWALWDLHIILKHQKRLEVILKLIPFAAFLFSISFVFGWPGGTAEVPMKWGLFGIYWIVGWIRWAYILHALSMHRSFSLLLTHLHTLILRYLEVS